MKKAVVYIHGKGGAVGKAAHYAPLFPDSKVLGFDYRAETPWEAKEEFPAYFAKVSAAYDEVRLIANSIGAFFAMHALAGAKIKKAYFISPIVDMERLISEMMHAVGVDEATLREKQRIQTPFGETLDYAYLTYVREHPVVWLTPTAVLYGENDDLQSLATIEDFTKRVSASLTVMPDGEHWFHTAAEMQFLDRWILQNA